MPRKIVIGTRNPNKVREVRHALEGLGLELGDLAAYPDVPDVSEDGATLEENARKKALHFARHTGELVLADDSGLEVAALNGRPGVFSSRYAGEGVSYADNNRKLLSEMEAVPDDRRGARFRCVIVLATADRVLLEVEGSCEGRIVREPRGMEGFGYDPVFFVPAQGMTFAEMSLDLKNRLSHRARALAKLAAGLAAVLATIGS